jgi:hypothetical protein
MRRSELELAMRRNTEARSDAERALEMARSVAEAGANSASVGRAQLTLARALHAEGKFAEARAAASSAVDQLGPALGEDHPETREARRVSEGGPP